MCAPMCVCETVRACMCEVCEESIFIKLMGARAYMPSVIDITT